METLREGVIPAAYCSAVLVSSSIMATLRPAWATQKIRDPVSKIMTSRERKEMRGQGKEGKGREENGNAMKNPKFQL